MGSSSGNSNLQSSGSEEDMLMMMMDERKKKRKQSNRESARRSRMRKQNHMDDLMNEVCKLGKEKDEIIKGIDLTTQQYLCVESQNSILRAQMQELTHRLQSLNQIIHLINTTPPPNQYDDYLLPSPTPAAENLFMNMNMFNHVNQPISASAEMLYQWVN
ncbi:hypothetical protein PIB30_002098 [Stylosanthes scabra]|uniref:BZIP domain-containing protein n=1 Tax=Stylosanthes scabra TaxID=79078 RepID=A0ABU6R472_9FABA|nr:hypothetical protein [Stylosanthes scabra]